MQCLEIAEYTWDIIDSKRYKIFKHTCTLYNNDYNMIVVQQCITARKQFCEQEKVYLNMQEILKFDLLKFRLKCTLTTFSQYFLDTCI